jgi:NADH-quinone oxidoreductase subunit M
MITSLILLPLIGAMFVAIAPENRARWIALAVTLVAALLALTMWGNFDMAVEGLQFEERYAWIPAVGAEYLVGIDGLSLLMVLLTSVLFPFALLAQQQSRGFCALMLVMQAALYGTFTAHNFVLWFLFFEMSLIPSFLLIKLWGGSNRDRAAMKFFVYTFLGSVAMLLAFLGIYLARGTFDFAALAALGGTGLLSTPAYTWLAFGGIFVGLAVKAALFPFHTWLPDAYENAPTGAVMVLSGALSKMGVYGFVRLLLPLFPYELRTLAPILLALAVCSIVFSALAAWAQTDLKRMIGYLSITHLGYCMLGLFAVGTPVQPPNELQAALSGVFAQMFNHGITAAALFYFVGLLEQRRGSRSLADFGGLMQRTPLLCGWMSVAMFSFLGLPGLNGFIGEFMIFKGSFAMAAQATAVAVLGLLFTAVVLLRAMQALFSGPLAESCSALPELRRSEMAVVVPASLLMIAAGVAPQWVFTIFNSTVVQLARAFV